MKLALAGNPNCGKTALFNALTGARQKVANYPGVTVERKEGYFLYNDTKIQLLDLPGTYSLHPKTPDEEVAKDILIDGMEGPLDAVIAVVDAGHLAQTLGLVLELKERNIPIVVALNMFDLAEQSGLKIDLQQLQKRIGAVVVPTVATTGLGLEELKQAAVNTSENRTNRFTDHSALQEHSELENVKSRFEQIDQILKESTSRKSSEIHWSEKIDRYILHPVWGSVLLVGVLFFVFQAIFNWSQLPSDLIEQGFGWLAEQTKLALGEGPLSALLTEGLIAGVGSILVFIPQILILFLFIFMLEDSGYMSRAAFLMDRLMGKVGLHGRAFIPLLSSYACAIPGIMATRTIENRKDRLTTILVAPLMTCAARLPVYTLLIGAFIPAKTFAGGYIGLQGLVLLGLYAMGLGLGLLVSLILKRFIFKDPPPPLLMHLPSYRIPNLKSILLALKDRAILFISRAGTVILAISILIWVLTSYPKFEGATTSEPAIYHSYAGNIGRFIEPVLKPIGMDWRIGIAFIPGFAAREVMVSALATVYSVEGNVEEGEGSAVLGEVLRSQWSLPTALSLLIWYVIACQCLSTLAVIKRETNSWRWPMVTLGYLTALAYLCSFVTYRTALWFGL